MTSTAAMRELAGKIIELQDLVAKTKVPQLAYSTLEAGAVTVVDELDNEIGSVGQQFDGSTAAVEFTGPAPLTPTVPVLSTTTAALSIRWDGLWSDGDVVPVNFTRVEIHIQKDSEPVGDVASTIYGTFETPRGGEQTFTLAPGTYYVALVARNLSGARGPRSVAASLVVEPVVADADLTQITADVEAANTAASQAKAAAEAIPADVTSGVIVAGAIANGTVIAGKIATNAVIAGTIAANAVTASTIAADAILARNIKAGEVVAGHLAVGAVIAGNIAANAVTAGTIAAGAITTDKLDANAINGLLITGTTIRTAASGTRMQLRPGAASNGYGNGVLELFTGNAGENAPAEIYTIADGPLAADNVSLMLQSPGKTGYTGRGSLQLFAEDADNKSAVFMWSNDTSIIGYGGVQIGAGVRPPTEYYYPTRISLNSVGGIEAWSNGTKRLGLQDAGLTMTGTIWTDDIVAGGSSVSRGWKSYASITALSAATTSTTVTDVPGLAVTASLLKGRRYRISAWVQALSTVADDRIGIAIRNSLGAQLVGSFVFAQVPNVGFPLYLEAHFTANSTGNATYTVGYYRNAGSGSVQVVAGTAAPAFLHIEDIGGS